LKHGCFASVVGRADKSLVEIQVNILNQVIMTESWGWRERDERGKPKVLCNPKELRKPIRAGEENQN
jgi:hypothetical protein